MKIRLKNISKKYNLQVGEARGARGERCDRHKSVLHIQFLSIIVSVSVWDARGGLHRLICYVGGAERFFRWRRSFPKLSKVVISIRSEKMSVETFTVHGE